MTISEARELSGYSAWANGRMFEAAGALTAGQLSATIAGRKDLDLFRSHELAHDRRRTVRVSVSSQGDGGLAVVDVATLGGSR